MADYGTIGPDSSLEQPAHLALKSACQQVGIDVSGSKLIRIGSNAVFRLNSDTVARVALSANQRDNVQRQIDVASWLQYVDYPAVRATDVPQPVDAEGMIVTFWESVAPETTYAPTEEVGALIRKLHALTVPPDLELHDLRPFGSGPVSDFPGLPDRDAQYLRARVEWARSAFPSLPFELSAGVIHGDANVGNVLVDSSGRAVLIDLDSFAVGPREWDLIQTALFYDRLGWHSEEEYEAFVESYGYDILNVVRIQRTGRHA